MIHLSGGQTLTILLKFLTFRTKDPIFTSQNTFSPRTIRINANLLGGPIYQCLHLRVTPLNPIIDHVF